MEGRVVEPNPGVLFTKCHLLNHLDEEGKKSAGELAVELQQHNFKIHKQLQRLMADGFIHRRKEKVKNHYTYFYSLTPFAAQYKRKNGLMSFLEKTNPMYNAIKKQAQHYQEPKRARVGKEIVIIPKKELTGFR